MSNETRERIKRDAADYAKSWPKAGRYHGYIDGARNEHPLAYNQALDDAIKAIEYFKDKGPFDSTQALQKLKKTRIE
jgi:hypothetical protein